MACSICDMISGKTVCRKLFEDDKAVAFLKEKPAAPGHIIIAPKEHHPIIENVPDFVVSHIFQVASRLSSAIFDTLGAAGTNIIVNNGIEAGQDLPHFTVNIIPRRENDGLNFQWQPKKLDDETLSQLEFKISEMAKGTGDFQQEGQKPINMDTNPETVEDDGENYLLKSLRRIP